MNDNVVANILLGKADIEQDWGLTADMFEDYSIKSTKPEGVPQEEWDASSPEVQAEIIRQAKEC